MNKYFAVFGLPGSFVLTMLISALAVVLFFKYKTRDRFLRMQAMFLSSVGDIFLMNFMGISKYIPNIFMIGATCFMLAHILYIAAFIYLIRKHKYKVINSGFVSGLIIIVITFISINILILKNGIFNLFLYLLFLTYLAIIGANSMIIFSYAKSACSKNKVHALVALGVFSFFISDLIIGLGLLCGMYSSDLMNLIWWFYPIGQILILLG